jgi:hypothetical protein
MNVEDERLAEVRASVRAGFEQLNCGEIAEYDESTVNYLAKDIKTRGRQQLSRILHGRRDQLSVLDNLDNEDGKPPRRQTSS